MADYRLIMILSAMALSGASSAYAEGEQRHDKTIETAMADRAASRIGEIRGTIGYDETPVLVTRLDLGIGESSEVPDGNALISSTSPTHMAKQLDMTTTASVPDRKTLRPFLKPPEDTVWDKFDRYGRPILD